MLRVSALFVLFIAGCGSAPPPPPATPPTTTTAPAPVATTTPGPSTAKSGDGKYSAADLDALEKAGSWQELLDHLEDVAPSARTDHWKAQVVKASIEVLKAERGKEHNRRALPPLTEALADRYTLLRSSPEFLDMRSTIIGDGLHQCLEDNNWNRCEEVAKPLDNDPKHAFANAKIVVLDRSLAMHLFLVAMADDAKTVCADNDALSLMLQGQSTDKTYRYFKDAQVVQQRCRDLKGKK